MWQLLIAVLILILLLWWVSTLARKKRKRTPDASFVCDVCGERDCVCHKEE